MAKKILLQISNTSPKMSKDINGVDYYYDRATEVDECDNCETKFIQNQMAWYSDTSRVEMLCEKCVHVLSIQEVIKAWIFRKTADKDIAIEHIAMTICEAAHEDGFFGGWHDLIESDRIRYYHLAEAVYKEIYNV